MPAHARLNAELNIESMPAEHRTPAELAMLDRFSRRYALDDSAVLREILGRGCGCEYSATSWTTAAEVRTMHGMLELAPGRRLLEVGTGAGWPGLYLAELGQCEVALLDLPLSGLRAIRRRTREGAAAGRWAIAGDGAALPFAEASFDGIVHSDVLCCLVHKQAVLEACRRVIRLYGTLVFSVISITPGLDEDDYRQASASGPPFIETPRPYPELLADTGWVLLEQQDLTAAYHGCLAAITELEYQRRAEIEALLGEQEIAEQFQRRHATLAALEAGLIRRDLFRARPLRG